MIRRSISFKHAIDGIQWALKTQPNYQIHLTLSLLAVIGGVVLKISFEEFVIIYALIFIGLALETVNTSVEKIADAITKDFHPDIKIAKDAAAGAMLFFACGAFVIACGIFLPKILLLFFKIH